MPLSGIFRGVRAYSTGYVPNPQRDRWKREDRRSRDQNERKKAAPEGGGISLSSSYGAKGAESQEHNDKAKYDKQTLLLSFRIIISHKIAPLFIVSIVSRRATKSPRRSTTGESTKKNKPYRNSHQNFKVLLHLFRIGIVISHKTTPFYSQLSINSRGKPKPSMRRPNPMRI